MKKINDKLQKANRDFDALLLEILNDIKETYTQKNIEKIHVQELIIQEKIKSDIHIGGMKKYIEYKEGYQLFFDLEYYNIYLKFYFSGKVELKIVCSKTFLRKESMIWKRKSINLDQILKILDGFLQKNTRAFLLKQGNK